MDDHSHHHHHHVEVEEPQHGAHGGGAHAMTMYFWSGSQVTFLIEGLEAHDSTSYALGWLFTFIIAFGLEGLLFLASYLKRKMQIGVILKCH